MKLIITIIDTVLAVTFSLLAIIFFAWLAGLAAFILFLLPANRRGEP